VRHWRLKLGTAYKRTTRTAALKIKTPGQAYHLSHHLLSKETKPSERSLGYMCKRKMMNRTSRPSIQIKACLTRRRNVCCFRKMLPKATCRVSKQILHNELCTRATSKTLVVRLWLLPDREMQDSRWQTRYSRRQADTCQEDCCSELAYENIAPQD